MILNVFLSTQSSRRTKSLDMISPDSLPPPPDLWAPHRDAANHAHVELSPARRADILPFLTLPPASFLPSPPLTSSGDIKGQALVTDDLYGNSQYLKLRLSEKNRNGGGRILILTDSKAAIEGWQDGKARSRYLTEVVDEIGARPPG